MFNIVRGKKISQQIISQIRGLIFEGKLNPGDMLPPENVLMEQFDVSKQTLREALRALEFIGLIDIKKGTAGGPCIAEMDSAVAQEMLVNFLYFQNLSVAHLSEVRKIVEPPAAAMAASSMSKEELSALQCLIEQSREKHKSGIFVQDTDNLDLEFHRMIGRSTKNPLLIIVIDVVESLMQDRKKLQTLQEGFSLAILEAHERIYAALCERDAAKAAQEMTIHIEEVQKQLSSMGDSIIWTRTAR